VHNPALRRVVGILWDVGSFWPRAAHPLAPPSYGERAVPDLVERVTELTATTGSRVVLSGHSQGSVLAAAAVMQLPHEVAERVDLVTHGSPLRRLYARHFPAYIDRAVLLSVADAVGDRWKNFYRDTDPIGSWVLHPDDARAGGIRTAETDQTRGIDHRLLDPPTLDDPIDGHADYWSHADYESYVRTAR
jgi:pimeloyl-ACP methyl ester carboxylesterase